MRMRFGPLNDGHPGAPRLEATVVGSGPAWVLTNGKTIKGTWKKTAITKPTRFYDKNGKAIPLTDRPDLRPGDPGQLPVHVQGRHEPAARRRHPEREPRAELSRPAGQGASVARTPTSA